MAGGDDYIVPFGDHAKNYTPTQQEESKSTPIHP